MQPPAAVIVTEYVPAPNPVAIEEFPPAGDQLKVNGGVPLVTVTVADPGELQDAAATATVVVNEEHPTVDVASQIPPHQFELPTGRFWQAGVATPVIGST